jgi:hypothetical protein
MTRFGCRCAKFVPDFFEGAGSARRSQFALGGTLATATRALGTDEALPLADTPNVDMHEVGAAIVAHSAAMQAQGCVTQLRRRNPRQANVDRLGLHMQAVLCHAGVRAARAQEFVAPGSTVAANYIDFTTGITERRGQVVEKVEEVRIEMTHISRTVIAQKMVELVQRFGDVLITTTIDDVQPLARVRVIKAEPVLACCRGRRFCAGVPEQRRQQK